MKIKFIMQPTGGRREFKVGDIVEFNGPVPEGYARKYIDRGWAEKAGQSEAVTEPAAAASEDSKTRTPRGK